MLFSIRSHGLSTRCLFFFNDTATTEIYTLSLHDALPICTLRDASALAGYVDGGWNLWAGLLAALLYMLWRSEEHTSELQSRPHLVCRLLLAKKKRATAAGRPARCLESTQSVPSSAPSALD